MLFVNYKIHASAETLISNLHKNEEIVEAEKMVRGTLKPRMTVKQNNSRIKMSCKMMGGPRTDNAFLEGTYFIGKISERNDTTALRGVIVTAPIYHLFIIALLIFFVIQCIRVGGINPIPLILVIFSIFMFKDEFKKQGLIKRYIFRAFKLTYAQVSAKDVRSAKEEETDA